MFPFIDSKTGLYIFRNIYFIFIVIAVFELAKHDRSLSMHFNYLILLKEWNFLI